MRRAGWMLLPVLAWSCSLFTSLDGLQGGEDAGSSDASIDANASDGSTKDAASDSAVGDSGPSLLSCDAPDLVAYWPMNEGSGTVAHDCHQALDGVFSDGGATWSLRGDSGAVDFTGAGYVSLGMPTALQALGPFTVCGWFRSDVVPGNYVSLLWNYEGTTMSGFEITLSSTGALKAQVGVGLTNIVKQFPAPAAGLWQHLTAVYDPGVELHLYVDGISVGATTMLDDGGPLPGLPTAVDDHDMRFGDNYDTGNVWSGGVDEIRVFSRVLTVDEIKILASQ